MDYPTHDASGYEGRPARGQSDRLVELGATAPGASHFRRCGDARYAWLAAVGIILALTAYLMRGWLFGGGMPTSARRETLAELTMVWMAKEDLIRGQLFTEWNRYWFSGFPWLRYLSYPLYYAIAAVSAWGNVSLEAAMVGFFVLALAGSALAMFGYLGQLLRDWRPALLGAVIYEAFPFHNHVGVETWIHAAFWVLPPLALWLIELGRPRADIDADGSLDSSRHTAYLLGAGVVLGLFPVMSSEYTLLVGPFVVLYLLLREWADVRLGRQTVRQAAKGCVLAGLVAAGTSCYFVLPALLEVGYVGIHAKHGGGTTFTNSLLSDYSVTPRLVAYAIARRWRLPVDNQGLPAILGSFWSTAWYPGVVLPFLALLGLFAVRRQFAARFALVALLSALLMVTGPTNSLNLFVHVPVLGRLSPFRSVLLVVLFVAMLAACGWAWLQRKCNGLRLGHRIPLSSILLVVALFAVAADFAPSAGAYQSTSAYFSPGEQQAYAWLKEHAPEDQQTRLWEVSVMPRDQYLRTYSLSQAPVMRFSGYYDNGAPLYAWQQGAWTDLRTRLRLQHVQYVMVRDADPDMDELREQLRSFGYRVVFGVEGIEIWENREIGDYARFHRSVALDASHDLHTPFRALPEFVRRDIAMVTLPSYYVDGRAAERIEDYDYILVDDPAVGESPGLQDLSPEAHSRMLTPDQVEWLAPEAAPAAHVGQSSIVLDPWRRGQLRLLVRAAEKGVLVLSESWYPHWRVWVDGQPQPLLRADWASLGVWLEPGEHQVEFRFQRPWYVYLGSIVSALTWLAVAAWLAHAAVDRFKRASRPVV